MIFAIGDKIVISRQITSGVILAPDQVRDDDKRTFYSFISIARKQFQQPIIH